MKLRWMAVSAGVAAAAVAVGACGSEPEAECVVARAVSDGSTGSFAATYQLKPGQNPDQVCARLKPEPLGMQKFFSPDPAGPDTVGVRSARLGKLLEDFASRLSGDSQVSTTSVGPFASATPGADHFCSVPELTPTRLAVPASTAPDGGVLPAQDYGYAWSNLRIYNTPEIPGTQFTADLVYTENGCTADYTVKGIWPVVKCQNSKTKLPDDALCDPYADYDAGRLRGSGINPLFPVKCDPDALICVLTGEVPSAP
ncbi:hypothetical protein D7X96_08380 [Corallococcus interemptor]|uniref:MlpA protein n=2 Tax=Corallococcus interemptor TaxID=2316720 RepID=A0A3A8R2U7_9BACT|nr:hypothetical protein D7Y23_00095 [Corallococcus sp. AB050B]RKH71512.1 hypothetical protein D7X96_08380 [Corallococcus interemptor]